MRTNKRKLDLCRQKFWSDVECRPHLWPQPSAKAHSASAKRILTSSLFKDFSNVLKKTNETSLFHDTINASSSHQGLNLAMLRCISQ